ncbi:hypothetical protein [Mariniluteicoccus flavus]
MLAKIRPWLWVPTAALGLAVFVFAVVALVQGVSGWALVREIGHLGAGSAIMLMAAAEPLRQRQERRAIVPPAEPRRAELSDATFSERAQRDEEPGPPFSERAQRDEEPGGAAPDDPKPLT